MEQISEAIRTAANPDKAFNVTVKYNGRDYKLWTPKNLDNILTIFFNLNISESGNF